MTHTFTVTRVADDPTADTDDPEYTIGGEHDNSCATFRPCQKDWHRHPKNSDDLLEDWATKRVPEVHYWMDGEWMVQQSECGLRYAFEYDNPEFQMTALGIYEVDLEWDGDYWIATLALAGAVHE